MLLLLTQLSLKATAHACVCGIYAALLLKALLDGWVCVHFLI